jgi:probable phosphoglycerate mutase
LLAAKPACQILEGYVKDGVVHLLGGELPDGIFVKIIRQVARSSALKNHHEP